MNIIEKLRFIKSYQLESFNDYPQEAVDNAKRALERNRELNNKCATIIGKRRANQISNKENLSIDVIKRTFSYLSRAKTYSDGDADSCGVISYNMWGGDAMLRWTENKLEELNLSKYNFVLPTPSSDDTEDKFISRCMRNNKMKEEFPNYEQRVGVCYSQWENRNK